jgi:hypothetical protein
MREADEARAVLGGRETGREAPVMSLRLLLILLPLLTIPLLPLLFTLVLLLDVD